MFWCGIGNCNLLCLQSVKANYDVDLRMVGGNPEFRFVGCKVEL